MARFHILVFTLLYSLACAFSIDTPPTISPSPSPAALSPLSPDSHSNLPPASASLSSPSPETISSPSPVNLKILVPALSPEIASAPSPAANDALPAPATTPISVSASSDMENPYVDADDAKPKSSSTGRKFGIAFGVVAGVCIIGIGGKVYKKRQDNIRRSRYHYSSREDFL